MKGKDDKEHTHTLAKTAKLTLDGKDCKAEDLKAGLKIRVTTKSDDAKAATEVEAISKNALFANTHDGKVVSATSSKLVMTGADGKEHSHTITDDTKVTCDKKDCRASDLKSGTKIRVTTKKSDETGSDLHRSDRQGRRLRSADLMLKASPSWDGHHHSSGCRTLSGTWFLSRTISLNSEATAI